MSAELFTQVLFNTFRALVIYIILRLIFGRHT